MIMLPPFPIFRIMAGILLLVEFAACSTTPKTVPLCPPMVSYTPQEQQRLFNEIKTHPDLPQTHIFLRDYGRLRAEIRTACP